MPDGLDDEWEDMAYGSSHAVSQGHDPTEPTTERTQCVTQYIFIKYIKFIFRNATATTSSQKIELNRHN